MLYNTKPVSLVSRLRTALFLLTVLWAVSVSILLLRSRPQTLLIGIDPYGVRVITSESDRLLKIERLNFVKKYLAHAYSFTSQDYDNRISTAGDMMSQSLWHEKKAEFERLRNNLKSQEVSQETQVLEIREVDPETFEADLKILVKTKLQESQAQIRVQLKLKRSLRSRENPYQYEVESYVEQTIS